MSATIVAIIAGVIGLAIVAVIVSKNANTANVLTSAGSALGSVIGQAVSPVTGHAGSNLFSSNAIGAVGSLFGGTG